MVLILTYHVNHAVAADIYLNMKWVKAISISKDVNIHSTRWELASCLYSKYLTDPSHTVIFTYSPICLRIRFHFLNSL